MSRDISLTFTEEDWQAVLKSFDDVDNDFPPDNVIEAIRNALCPNGHTEKIESTPQITKYNNWRPYYVNGTCTVCREGLWSIRPSNWITHEYTYQDYSDIDSYKNRVIFSAGDEKDPKKVDLSGENSSRGTN